MRKQFVRIFVALLVLFPLTLAQSVQHGAVGNSAQPTLTQQIDMARHSVVQIAIFTTDLAHINAARPTDTEPIAIQKYFLENSRTAHSPFAVFVAGTGFLIDNEGDIVTAGHVMAEAMKIEDILKTWGVTYEQVAAFPVDNKQGFGGSRIDNSIQFAAKLLALDRGSDIAMLSTSRDIFKDRSNEFRPRYMTPSGNPAIAPLDIERPQDGDEVFALGFPQGSRELISTSGHMASAYFMGGSRFAVDLRVNFGNSGGPLFSSKGGVPKVIGVIDAMQDPPGAGTAIVIPAKNVVDFAHRLHLSLP
jgi:S1-C subfamily serine protease